jgi:hypothetical protein
VLTGLAQHRRGAQCRLGDEVGGDGAWQAEQDPGVDHRLDEEEEVGRSAAGQGGDRVLLRLGHPDRRADGGEQTLGAGEVGLGGVRAGRQCAHREPDPDRGVGHDPDDRNLSGEGPFEGGEGDPGGHRHDELVGGHDRAELGEQRGHVLRLDGQEHHVRSRGGRGVAGDLDAVAGGEGGGVLGPALGHDEVGGRHAAGEQTGQQRLAEHPRAEHGDPHDRLASARRKKPRLAGRSASRRIR